MVPFKGFHWGGTLSNYHSRSVSPLRHFLQMSKRQEWAFPSFSKLFTHLQMLEGTIQQLYGWLTHFLQFGFTNTKCNCYILISKDGQLLSHFPSLVHAHIICCWFSQEGDTQFVLYSSVQNEEGWHKHGVPPAIPHTRPVLAGVTPSSLWIHPSPPQQVPSSAKHPDCAYIKQQPGRQGETEGP